MLKNGFRICPRIDDLDPTLISVSPLDRRLTDFVGKGPFAAVIWSHGRVEKAKTSGWQRMCKALASEGVLAFIPIREIERDLRPSDIPYNQAELSRAVDYVK